jgi:hypothetical protein
MAKSLSSLFVFGFFATAIYCLAVIALPGVAAVASSVVFPQPEIPASYWKEMPEIEWASHAELTHPVVAPQARNCLEHHGPTAYFIESEKNGHGIHFLCKYPGENDVYTLVFDFCKKSQRFIQRTAFDKAKSLSDARSALIKKGGRWIESPKIEHLYEWLLKYGLY